MQEDNERPTMSSIRTTKKSVAAATQEILTLSMDTFCFFLLIAFFHIFFYGLNKTVCFFFEAPQPQETTK